MALKFENVFFDVYNVREFARGVKVLDENAEDKLKSALFKKALGGVTSEQICEYSIDENGQQILSKKKVTHKQVSPDLAALKFLLESYYRDADIEKMSDLELKTERARLLQLLKEEEEDADGKMHENDEV